VWSESSSGIGSRFRRCSGNSSGDRRKLTEGIEGLLGVHRKLAEGIGGLPGVRRELTKGDRGLAGSSLGAHRRRSGACQESDGSSPKVIGSLPGMCRRFTRR
ncbi:hypothetical protein BHM03_00028504, partial [Ensete ventricosum]